MNKICIGLPTYEGTSGGIKAKRDAIAIAQTNGFKLFELSSFANNIHIKDFLPITELANLWRLRKIKNCIVFIQHPFPLFAFEVMYKKLCKQNKVILLSHDLEYIRFGAEKQKKHYIDVFNNVSCIISHNKKYSEQLKADGVTTTIIELGIFDYIAKIFTKKKTQDLASICFVGNLGKSKFINNWIDLPRNYTIDLIGSTDKEFHKNATCNYLGVFDSDEVPIKIPSAFGLVWDGDSIDNCEMGGGLGRYLKINNPHKFSLYMAAGIPVFVWKDSALADFVKENKVGFTIDSLNEINSILQKLTEREYLELKENTLRVQRKVLNGEYLDSALKKALAICSK